MDARSLRGGLAVALFATLALGCFDEDKLRVDVDAATVDVALDALPDDLAPGVDGPAPPTDTPSAKDAPVDAPVPCTTDAQCADPTPRCDVDTGRCVECLPANDACPVGRYCSAENNLCVPGCRDAADCATPAAPDGGAADGAMAGLPRRCDVARHACIECETDDECPLTTICTGGVCIPGCNARRGCSVGETCCNSQCVDTATDDAHCGACGRPCAPPNAAARCAGGACSIRACVTGYADCNGQLADGCEADLPRDSANCGRCGNACPTLPHAATVACVMGRCGFACDAAFGDCDGMAANGCETDLRASVEHCNACGNRCVPRPNGAAAQCVASACGVRCDANFGDCDGDLTNGCETRTDAALAHCGACGNACPARPHAEPTCAAGRCGIRCEAGYGDCDGDPANGCETDTRATVAHCGRCGNECRIVGGTPACIDASCAVAACGGAFADCDTSASNGCETDTRASATHCGACGNPCPARPHASPACAASVCGVTCDAGWGDCDGMAANGCETDLRADVRNCGACRRECAAPSGTPGCAGAQCTVASCVAGRGNCDGVASNGCEADLATDANHCGACGMRPPEVCNGRDDNCNTRADEGCPRDLGDLNRVDFTSPLFGNSGSSTAYDLTCPDGTFARGIFGRTNSYVTQLGLLCGRPRLVIDRAVTPHRYSVAVDATGMTAPGGAETGTAFTYTCPANTLVTRVIGRQQSVIFAVGVECAPWQVNGNPAAGFTVTRGAVTASPLYGTASSGAAFDYTCPTQGGNASAVRQVFGRWGIVVRFILALTSVTVRCTLPTLLYQ
jgi:hypothetical protein